MLSQRLKELRQNKEYTQEYVGKIVHVSDKTVGAWERGIRQPSIESIQSLARLFNVTTDYLLGAESPKDDKDLKNFLDQNFNRGMTYDNKELTDGDREKLKIALTQIFWKYRNKK
ncbi:helix-turn-helix domain-containing protein [Liquorilactobacillus hordei]|uniref:helix-turn-helix domain-containing protein n=1 Tax=Liquorilactobacillus hordei TaxID=468911 RepID=UPI0039E9C05C